MKHEAETQSGRRQSRSGRLLREMFAASQLPKSLLSFSYENFGKCYGLDPEKLERRCSVS